MNNKLYYARKQQSKVMSTPLNTTIKPFKYWLQVGVILVVTFGILFFI